MGLYVYLMGAITLLQSHLWGMKREPIRTPFLSKNRDADYADSIAIFKLLLRFMNDTSLSGNRETVLADYIVNKVTLVHSNAGYISHAK